MRVFRPMRALSVRQPWAELIILGHKTIEVRSQRINIRERVHIYAGRNRIETDEEHRIAAQFGIDVDGLPRGVLIGTIEIVGCRPLDKSDSPVACFEIDQAECFYAWLLDRPERAENLQTPTKHPQPVFFNPF
jgi:hypothetical protein